VKREISGHENAARQQNGGASAAHKTCGGWRGIRRENIKQKQSKQLMSCASAPAARIAGIEHQRRQRREISEAARRGVPSSGCRNRRP